MTNYSEQIQGVLSKLNISALNPMQEDAIESIEQNEAVIILSPTGTGKTLAFLLPLIQTADNRLKAVQILIIVPTRELAIQIEQVVRSMGAGFSHHAVYGGLSFSKDKEKLKNPPAILVGTPGRIADHLRRETFDSQYITSLVLDEFDKSLEIGFESEMREIISYLSKPKHIVLTSASQKSPVPDFLSLDEPKLLNYLEDENEQLKIQMVLANSSTKEKCLAKLLAHNGNKPGIIFCNYKDSIQVLSDFLKSEGISHGCFFGGLEQKDRERALIKFRNGSNRLLIATDLAARGIDIPEIEYIIHYELPKHKHEFIHRNGRTARMLSSGTAYVLVGEKDRVPDFIVSLHAEEIEEKDLKTDKIKKSTDWETVFVSGGRGDKISKGDIAGFFMKQGNLGQSELGLIEIKHDCAFVAVDSSKVKKLIQLVDNTKLKTKKVRVSLIE